MRTIIVLLVTAIAAVQTVQAAASTPTKSDAKAECNTAPARAFKKSVDGLIKKYAPKAEVPDELYSKDPTFRSWVNSPKSTLAEVERFMRCNAAPELEEVRLISLSLVCLDLDSQLAYIGRLAQAPRTQANSWALHYTVSPGNRWSTRLDLGGEDPNVRNTLGQVFHSPNGTPGLQRIVYEILEGISKKYLSEHPAQQLLTCSATASK
jgi:hypothetical protein